MTPTVRPPTPRQVEWRGELVWQARILWTDENGKRRDSRGFHPYDPDTAVSRAWANYYRRQQLLTTTGTSQRPQPARPRPEPRGRRTLAWLYDQYVNNRDRQLNETTLDTYNRLFSSAIAGTTKRPNRQSRITGTTPIIQLNEDNLRRLIKQDWDSIGTKRRWDAIKLLEALLNHAVKKRWLKHNPLASIDKAAYRPSRTKVQRTDTQYVDARITYLKNLLAYLSTDQAPEKDRRHRTIILTALTTGLRSSELCGLCWSDIQNLTKKSRCVIWVQHTTVRHAGGTITLRHDTKTGVLRKVPIPEETRKALLTLKKSKDYYTKLGTYRTQPGTEDLVFLKPDGTPWDRKTYGDLFRRINRNYLQRDQQASTSRAALTENGRDYLDIRPSITRHIFASITNEYSAILQGTQAALGHTTPRQTTTYTQQTHIIDDAIRETITKRLNLTT